MKRVVAVFLVFCMSTMLFACGGGSGDESSNSGSMVETESSTSGDETSTNNTGTVPDGLSETVYDLSLELLELNDQYDAKEIDGEAALNDAKLLLESLKKSVSTELDETLYSYLTALELKFEDSPLSGEAAEGYSGMQERQIERAKDVLGIEY